MENNDTKKVNVNHKKAEILAQKISEMKRGSEITHSIIEDIIDVERSENRYGSVIAKAKKILLEKYSVCIENVKGIGYRVILPGEFVDESLKQYKRGFKSMQKGNDVIKNAPTKHMTQDELSNYRRFSDRVITLNAAMRGAAVELKTLAKKDHPMLPENVNRV